MTGDILIAGARAYGSGKASPAALAGLAAVALLAIVVIWFLVTGPEPDPVPVPDPATRPLETVAPAETGEERGDAARDIITDLREQGGPGAGAEAFARAEEFAGEGRHADAQLLYFFAARSGHAPAALALAAAYDPLRFSAGGGLADEPDPFQAYRWYREAAASGNEQAGERLAELKAWAEEAAGAGDVEAEQLLLQWE